MSRSRLTPTGDTGKFPSDFRAEVGQRLGHVLAELAERQDIARGLGRGATSIESYVQGTKAPPFETLARLAALTGVSLDWLAFGQEPIMRASVADQTVAPIDPQPGEPATPPRVDPETLAIVIRAILEALDEERLTLFTYATSELIALVYDAVCAAGSEVSAADSDPVEIAKDNLRRILPLILSGRTS